MKNCRTNLNLLNVILAFACSLVFLSSAVAQDDWQSWRGPTKNGIAAEDQTPPVKWSETENVVWKTKVPGRGHATPIVVGNKIFLATADDQAQTQSVVCFDRASGSQVWQTQINQGAFNPKMHPKNNHASTTIATDGERLFVVFNNHGGVQVAAVDYDGKLLWEKVVGEFKAPFPFGFSTSPIVYDGNVIVTNLNNGEGSGLFAFNGATGDEVWRVDRPAGTSYSTPVIAEVAGEPQLLLSGTKKVFSFNPTNGKENWMANSKWSVSCGIMVWDKDLVFASGGYPDSQTLAINAKTGKMVWENRVKVYEQSMLAHDGYIYAHSDNGALYCWQAKDGQEMWKQRFSNRKDPQSASPVYANGNIYFTTELGETLVIKASPKGMEEVARNKLGDESFASLALSGNQIFARVAKTEGGSRQEWLYCLGE